MRSYIMLYAIEKSGLLTTHIKKDNKYKEQDENKVQEFLEELKEIPKEMRVYAGVFVTYKSYCSMNFKPFTKPRVALVN